MEGRLTVVNASGRKKMLTNVSSLTFSPSLVDALLSITALALKSWLLSAQAAALKLRYIQRPLKPWSMPAFA